VPGPLLVRPVAACSRRVMPSHDWRKLEEDRRGPSRILDDGVDDIRAFTITMSRQAGTKRGQGQGSFVESVLGSVDRFYGEVVQNLKSWSAPAPKTRDEEPQVVVPTGDSSESSRNSPITTTALVLAFADAEDAVTDEL
jgi:hypothetical protein